MADYENFSEINENFDTIKTLLNSIRAQGILNTSDVDKLLTGINTKLEKINTEEDIDLIKIFLSELKQNLEERHGILISKFGAIESLFSNLLKNSSEMPKSTDIKELFDIVATNLSVFSREVVSQKDTLTDITLRLDAMRSDDSQKKDIIKNIALLKSDLERLNNGFDSIVINLNDNFKTIAKTIAALDKTEDFDKFGNNLSSIEMSANTILSALQMLDKKTGLVEESLQGLATKDDIGTTNKKIFELNAQSQELTAAVTDLSDRYVRVDNLADKIDASVNIIATLKSTLETNEDNQTQQLIEKLNSLQEDLQGVVTSIDFNDFKDKLQEVLLEISQATINTANEISLTKNEARKISEQIDSLDIKVNFENLFSLINKSETEIKQFISDSEQRINTLNDANITRVLNDITSNAESLGSKLNQTQSSLAVICEKNFGSVFENISDLRRLLSQIDENSISANNAIFSSITDRLTSFEEDLRNSLEAQEKSVTHSSSQVIEQVENIKNLSNILDYKIDSSVVELGNVKREFGSLQTAVENVLALDFVTAVKDLRVDLYASKQEFINTVENADSELAEKFTNDLYGKYELLISKLDSVEDEIKKAQLYSLTELRTILEKISSSIVDVLSYVSEAQTGSLEGIDAKFISINENIKETSISYVEDVRNIIEQARLQVENNLKSIEDATEQGLDIIKKSISENSEDIKKDIKYSYSKLLEIQDSYNELKEILNVSELSSADKLNSIVASSSEIKADFENKLLALKSSLFDRISDFKQEITCENTDKTSEFKFTVENLFNKNIQDITNLVSDIKQHFTELSEESSKTKAETLTELLENFSAMKSLVVELNDKSSDNLTEKVDSILKDFATVKEILDKVDENVDGDMTRQLSIIESNFESLVSQITILFEKSDKSLTARLNDEFTTISSMTQSLVAEKLDSYKATIENSFSNIEEKNKIHTEYVQERIANLNSVLKEILEEQSENNTKQIQELAESLNTVLNNNSQVMTVDFAELKGKINEFAKNIQNDNTLLVQEFKAKLNEVIGGVRSDFENTSSEIDTKINTLKSVIAETSVAEITSFETLFENVLQQIDVNKQNVITCKELIVDVLKQELILTGKNIEKETDVIINELIEQFDILKASQADDIVSLTSRIEEIINSQIYNNIEDLKSYLDIKTDNSVLSSKLDNLKIELTSSISNTIENLNKLLDTGVFTSAMSDYKLANEVLINSAVDNINDKIDIFINENAGAIKELESKLNIFDKKLVETLVEKFEEIKVLSNEQNKAIENINISVNDILNSFDNVKAGLEDKIDTLKNALETATEFSSKELQKLQDCFENLRSQISNKSFDEAFQASINKQIASLETLITEQLGYIEDINDLCATTLPDVTELNTLVKHSILESIKKFSDKLDEQDIEGIVERELKQVKSDIITQILNVFNQVSFVAEQEEILDFIQEKHDDLITVLSHIVTTSDEIVQVKDSVSQLNEKINAIISSDGDIDYIYSLQDLESDIANLRLVLNEMNENSKNSEFANLVNSTEEIYKLVESVKDEIPTKADFDNLSEDIISISSRTNKLLLASDESYKTLQDNLQEFKLVINDIDERTRNFAQESGMDRLDAKLNAINTMMQNGAKSNQIFNQVFEYLAEWVDNASVQINSISDKVDTLDEIGEIKTLISDMKAQDDVENEELAEVLGSVFTKQTKRISSLEKKLDKIIVETTINKQPDLTPMENTLNKFLVAMDEKISGQQEKINILESKLESVMSILAEKDSQLISKKVGSMDKQIAKLSKNIEKLTSHVIET
ncbi:MAG: hypothetical protein E7Z92_04985 [Cyanobacteria bacterium SIG31]|nr:hypothetical protein [Cyanobacteria bacterium SIG31]